jgi:hypothetical protein
MENPIPHSSLFATPADLMELDLMIRSLSLDSERALAYRISMMTMNLCYEMIEAEKAKEVEHA